MRSALRRSGSGAFAAMGALLLGVSAFLCGCGLDWNLGLWTPPEEKEAVPPADRRIGSVSGLTSAWGVAVDGDYLYVTDPLSHKLYKLDKTQAGQTGEKVWSKGSLGSGDLQFDDPRGVAVNSGGKVFVADRDNGRVKKLTSSGDFEMDIGVGDLSQPVGVAVDLSNNLYVTDESLHSVFVFDSGGNLINQWNGSETSAGIFNTPSGVAVGSFKGQLYVVDRGNHQVKVFLTDGTFVNSFGSQGAGNGQFDDPWGIAVDAGGKIYVSDLTRNRIQQFDPDGVYLADMTTPNDDYGELREPAGLDYHASYLYAAENQAKWVRAIPIEDF